MNVEVLPFQLDGCQCRLKFDPKELQILVYEEINKKIAKQAKYLDQHMGDLKIGGRFTEIDEGNFALHFMLAFLGKAWISGQMQVAFNGKALINEPFRISNTYAAFTAGKGQLTGDAKYLGDQVVKKTVKALKKTI